MGLSEKEVIISRKEHGEKNSEESTITLIPNAINKRNNRRTWYKRNN